MHIVTPRGSAKNKTEMKLIRAFLVAQMVENQSAMQETWVWSLGWKDPLKEGMATHSSILAWRIPLDRGAWRAIQSTVEQLSTALAS